MRLGDIIKFKYKKKGANDYSPVIVYVEEDSENIRGVNINYISREYLDIVFKLIKRELLSKTFSINDIEEHLEDLKYIEKRIEAKELLKKNSGVSMEALKKSQMKKDTKTLYEIINKSVRTYNKNYIKLIKEIKYQEYIDGTSQKI
jgi:hypothetical protein